MSVPWVAVWESTRPHVHPLRTLAGRTLTVDAPSDHPWHHGLWSTIKYVNGTNFWEEHGEFGRLVTRDVTAGGVATIDWLTPAGVVAVREQRRLGHRPIDDRSYAIEWTFALTAPAPTVFDRTPFTTWGGYGGLTLRGAPDWNDTELRLADGSRREVVHGARGPWCALVSDAATVAIFDHPANPRWPTPWYGSTRAATYGDGWANFLNAAFLWDAPLALDTGATLCRRHLVVVADGPLDAAALDAHHARWTQS